MSSKRFLPKEDELLLEHGTNPRLKRRSWKKLVLNHPELKGRTPLSCQRRFQKLRQKLNNSASTEVKDRVYTAAEDEAILRTIASLPGAWRSEPYWRDLRNPILKDRTKSGLRCRARTLMRRLPDYISNLTDVEIADLKKKYKQDHIIQTKTTTANVSWGPFVETSRLKSNTPGPVKNSSEETKSSEIPTASEASSDNKQKAKPAILSSVDKLDFTQNEDLVILNSIVSCANNEAWKSKEFWAKQNLKFGGKTANCVRNRAKLLLQNLHEYKDVIQPEDLVVMNRLSLQDKRMVHEQLQRKAIVPAPVIFISCEAQDTEVKDVAENDSTIPDGAEQERFCEECDVSGIPIEYREAATEYYHTMGRILAKLELYSSSSLENVKEMANMTFAGLYAVHGFISGKKVSGLATESVRKSMVMDVITAKYVSTNYSDAAEFLFYAMAYNAKNIATL